jgi:hypothetical protein
MSEVRFRFDTYDVYGDFCNVRVWAGGPSGRLANCGILVFFTEEWFAFQRLLSKIAATEGIEIEITRVDEARRQLSEGSSSGLDSPVYRPREEERS